MVAKDLIEFLENCSDDLEIVIITESGTAVPLDNVRIGKSGGDNAVHLSPLIPMGISR